MPVQEPKPAPALAPTPKSAQASAPTPAPVFTPTPTPTPTPAPTQTFAQEIKQEPAQSAPQTSFADQKIGEAASALTSAAEGQEQSMTSRIDELIKLLEEEKAKLAGK